MSTRNPHRGQNAAVLLNRTYVFAAFGGRWRCCISLFGAKYKLGSLAALLPPVSAAWVSAK
jgi:hypothetical protein